MIPYQIRSVQLLNLVRDIKNESLIPQPYFQRNLVWREAHKKDLIDTILSGYPFPLIFISQGEIDVENMKTTSCIVDGQQRCDAIVSFIDGKFKVNGRYFSEFSEKEKADFFKYEIPVCEVDVLNTSDEVQEMFKRINRTSNSLTQIEKTASEYGASYFMLVAKLISDQIDLSKDVKNTDDITIDPNIPDDFMDWARNQNITHIKKILTNDKIFTALEISKKVNLQYALNLMCTYMDGFYNRNDNISDNLQNYVDNFDRKDDLLHNFENTAAIFLGLKLDKKSMWYRKANFFTLFIYISDLLSKGQSIEVDSFKKKLLTFEPNEDYQIAAREGVNNKKERKFRNDFLKYFFAS